MNAVISALRDSVADGDAARAHKLVEEAVSTGADRQELLAGLNKLMPDFHADEAALDILTDIGDRLAGWCSPSSRL